MEKSKRKVNMKSVKILIFVLMTVFFSIPIAHAQIDRTTNSTRMEYDKGPDGGKSIMQSFFEIFFNSNGSSGSTTNGSTSYTNPYTNSSLGTDTTGLDPSLLATYPTPQTVNGFKVYRQCNYRNVQAVNGTCANGGTLCNMGCGITSASMIISTLTHQNVDPPTLLTKYRANGAYIGCNGTNAEDAKKIIEQYGLKTSGYLFTYSLENPATINQVAADIREKVKNGWYVFVLANFCNGRCGHYFVITDIDQNNVVTSYDPYYEIPESSHQPINYTSHYPFPKYQAAFAVKKT